MPARILALAGTVVVVAALPAGAHGKPAFAEPDDGPDPRGLTLQGSGVARVERPVRPGERTIERAVEAARSVAQARALRDARRRARTLADAAGLTLGPVRAVTARLTDSERYAATDRHCDRTRRAARLRCRAPSLSGASVRVTFATRETSATTGGGRAVVASGNAIAPVRPRHMTSPSIRAALGRAQLAADPQALALARRRAVSAARAAGLRLGPLFALAEEPRAPFAPDIVSAPFGPGRFCEAIRKVRRCYVPPISSVLRVTFVAR